MSALVSIVFALIILLWSGTIAVVARAHAVTAWARSTLDATPMVRELVSHGTQTLPHASSDSHASAPDSSHDRDACDVAVETTPETPHVDDIPLFTPLAKLIA
jgi:hypothetical protein